MALDTIIELRKASIFQQDHLVLADVNLMVNKGDLVYLIGKVGSGKSSLLKTLYAELPFKVGLGKVSDFELKNIKRKDIPFLRRKLGIVFQDFQLMTDRSVYDNLKFVLKSTGWKKKSKINTRIHDVLEKVDLIDKIFSMPHKLSGGEQQRIVIARALLNEPDIILADEPTGNLDPKTSEDIMKILIEISNSGRAVVIATHDYPLIKKFPSTIYKCNEGSFVEVFAANEEDNEKILETYITREREIPDLIKPGDSVDL